MEIIEPKYFLLNCNFIAPGLSYEDYLLEILNWSEFFRSKSQDRSEYKAPISQDNGEADAYSSEYQIDFKLLVNEEVMRVLNKNRPSVNKEHIKKGIIIINDNPNPTPTPSKNILVDIMNITLDELKSKSFSNATAEHFVKNLEKEKNLFLYYPYEYVTKIAYPVNAFANMLTKVFSIPLCYRKMKYPNMDTFVCIKVNEYFLIFEWVDNDFIYRDRVNESLCTTYTDYRLYSFF